MPALCARLGVGSEIALPLELHSLPDRNFRQARLQLDSSENLERIGIQVVGEIAAFGNLVRVLDLADRSAALAGRILADLGAEVTMVEPPGGNSIRRCAPRFRDDTE